MLKRGRGFFKPRLLTTLLTIAAVSLFLALGNWQLHRAAEKQALLDLQTRRMQMPPVRLGGGESLAQLGRYRRVWASGRWDPAHQFLLDARTYKGAVGYEVLTPLVLDGGRVILVNRGWIPAPADRRRLPSLDLEARRVTVRGRVDLFPRAGMHLEGMSRPSPGWPALVQVLVPEVAGRRLGAQVADFQIKMDSDSPDGYVRDWRLSHIRPQRNRGYAFQWFSFAFLVLVLWIWHGLRRSRSKIERKRDEQA